VKFTKSTYSNIQDYADIHLPDQSHIVMNSGLQNSRKDTNNKVSTLKPAQNRKRRHKEA